MPGASPIRSKAHDVLDFQSLLFIKLCGYFPPLEKLIGSPVVFGGHIGISALQYDGGATVCGASCRHDHLHRGIKFTTALQGGNFCYA